MIFPGQGAHRPEMIDGLQDDPLFLQDMHHAGTILGEDLISGMQSGGMEYLSRPEVVSVMTVGVGLAHFRRYVAGGGDYTAVAGYSVGQWTALYAAGVLSAEQTIDLTIRRAHRLRLAAQAHPGAMIAVIGLSDHVVEVLCEDFRANGSLVWVANFNAPGQLTVSAEARVIEAVMAAMKTAGAQIVERIAVQGAWHCPLMDMAATGFAEDLEPVTLQQPKYPVIDNLTGRPMCWADAAETRRSLARHLACPVRWADGIRHLTSLGIEAFVEVGYGDMLTRFGMFIDRSRKHRALVNSPRPQRRRS